jgi:hypothetical protein
MNRGIVKHVGSIKESEKGKPSNHYVISDPLVAKFLCPAMDIFEFMQRKIRKCPKCGTYNVRDWDTTPIQSCSNDQVEINGAVDGQLAPDKTPIRAVEPA